MVPVMGAQRMLVFFLSHNNQQLSVHFSVPKMLLLDCQCYLKIPFPVKLFY